jgi:hypothetical protein
MAKSNWNGSSGWGAISDPTGVLTGRVLVATAGVSTSTEDYLYSVAGTSNEFKIDNYSTSIQFAWPTSTATHPFADGTLGIIARSSTYSGEPTKAQNGYIGELDYGTNKVNIIRRNSGVDTIIKTSTLPSGSDTRGVKHTLEFRSYGTTSVTLQLLLNNTVIESIGDVAANKLTSGRPGLKIQSGTVYINDFTVYQYTSDGEAPATWLPTNITGQTLSAWWKADAGTTVSGTSLSAWADQSTNTNNFSQATAGQQPQLGTTQINGLPSVKFDGTTNMSAANHSSLGMQEAGTSIFIMINPSSFTTGEGNAILTKGSSYAMEVDGTSGFYFVGQTDIKSASFCGTTNVYQIISAVTDRSNTTGNGGLYLDGTKVVGMTNGAGDNNDSVLVLGNALNADIAEVVLVQGQTTTDNRTRIEGYLAHKYNTWPRLPSNHPYKYITPTADG